MHGYSITEWPVKTQPALSQQHVYRNRCRQHMVRLRMAGVVRHPGWPFFPCSKTRLLETSHQKHDHKLAAWSQGHALILTNTATLSSLTEYDDCVTDHSRQTPSVRPVALPATMILHRGPGPRVFFYGFVCKILFII